MRIVTWQQELAELGRIRIGHQVPIAGGKTRPEKLTKFRFTSASEPLLEKVAARYGGTVQPWTPEGGDAQWEVYSEVDRVPIYVPPQPVSQSFEAWAGKSCERRCDGMTEYLSNQPCLCGVDADSDERLCKPTTRLWVLLREVPGIGRWRLESRGRSAALQLPGIADFLSQAPGLIPADLFLVPRTARHKGKTFHFVVPRIEADIAPAEIVAGRGGVQPEHLESAPSYARGPAELVAAEHLDAPQQDVDSFVAALTQASTADQLRGIWTDAQAAGVLTPQLRDALRARAEELSGKTADPDDANQWWAKVLASVPGDWTTTEAEAHFEQVTGVDAGQATADDMRRYLESRKTVA